MGSGKTTAARYTLSVLQPSCILHFAEPGKAMVGALLVHQGLTHSAAHEALYGASKEVPLEAVGGFTPRRLMQTLGGDWGRNTLGEDFWVRIMRTKLERLHQMNHYAGFLFDDVRYPNEMELIREFGGQVIRVVRPRASVTSPHESEGQLATVKVDATIENDGDLMDMHVRTHIALEMIGAL